MQPSVEIGPHGGENRRHKRSVGEHAKGFVLFVAAKGAHKGEKGLNKSKNGEDETRLMRRNIVEDEHERFFMETNSHKERHKASLMRQELPLRGRGARESRSHPSLTGLRGGVNDRFRTKRRNYFSIVGRSFGLMPPAPALPPRSWGRVTAVLVLT